MSRVNYGEDYLISVPLIDGGGTEFLAAIPTIAAGDAKIDPDTVMVSGVREPGLQVNPDAFILGFDSMSVLPSPGDQISEATGDGVATVMFVVAVAGTNLSTGDISGFMFVKSVTGTWTDNINIDNDTTTDTNIATVDAGTTGVYTLATNQIANTAGLFAFAKGKAWLAITAEELTCKELEWRLKDQTATEEWEDTSGILETEGHPAAKYPNGARYAGIIGAPATDLVSATSINIPQSGHADYHDQFDDAGWVAPATDDLLNGMTIKVWDPTNRDRQEIAQIADWDAAGHADAGANEGNIQLAGRGFTKETDLDGATTLYWLIYDDYNVVVDALGTQAKADVNAEADTAILDTLVLALNGITATTTGTPTTTVADLTSLSTTPAVNALRGRTAVFENSGTGALQATRIASNTASQITYATLATAPASGVDLKIV